MGDRTILDALMEGDLSVLDGLPAAPPPKPGAMGYVQQAGSSLLQGAAGTIGEAVRGAGTILGSVPGVDGSPAFPQAAYDVNEALPATMEQSARGIIPEVPGARGSFLADTLPRAIGSTLPFVATGGVGAMAGLPPALMAATTGALVNGSAGFYEAKLKGADETTQWKSFALNAALGTSQAAEVGRIFSRINKASGGMLTRVLVDGAVEGGQEAVEQAGSNIIAQHLYDPERKTLEGVAQGGGAGFLTGMLLAAVTPGHGRRTPEQPQAQPPATVDLTGGGPSMAAQESLGAADASKGSAPILSEQPGPVSPVSPGMSGGEAGRVASPEQTYATELAAQHGARATFDPTLGPREQGSYPGRGDIRLNPNLAEGDVAGVVIHELTHHLREVRGETWAEMDAAIRRADPEGHAKAFAAYGADFQRAMGQPVTPELQGEEATARYVQGISAYVRQAIDNPGALESKAPGVLHSIAKAVVDMLDAIGLAVPKRLRSYVDTPLLKAKHEGIAREVAKALKTLQDESTGSEAPLSEALAPRAEASPPAPAVSPPEGTAGVSVSAPSPETKTAAPVEALKKDEGAAPLNVPAQMPRGAQLGTDLLGNPIYSKEERGDLKRPDVKGQDVTQIGLYDDAGMFQAEAEARDQGVAPPSELRTTAKKPSELARERARNSGSLRKFVRAIGGIKFDANEGSDLHNAFSQKEGGTGSFGLGPLVHGPKSTRGMHWEAAMQSAVDAGFFPGRTYGDITYREFYDAIESDISRPADVEARAMREQERADRERAKEKDPEREAIQKEKSAPKNKKVRGVPFAVAPRRYRYKMKYRPPSAFTLPKGLSYEVEAPSKDAPFGIVSYEKPLSFKDEEAFDLEPLDPGHPKNIRKTIELRRERLVNALSDNDTIIVSLHGKTKFFGPDTRKPGRFRLTSFTETNEPSGHEELGELSDALDELARMGAEPSSAKFAVAPRRIIGYDLVGEPVYEEAPKPEKVEKPKSRETQGGLFTPKQTQAFDLPNIEVEKPRKYAVAPTGSFDLPDDTRTRQFTRAVLDSFEALRLTPELDSAISRRPGLAYGRAERVQAQTIRGMIEIAKAVGKENADRFLYALHAPRRNEIIAERSKGKYGAESNPGSGMRTSEAQAITRAALAGPNKAEYQRLRDLNRRLNQERLDALTGSGLLSQEQRTEWEQFGPDFVPLRTADDPSSKYGGGSLNVTGKESQRAEGRSTLADSPLSFGVARFAEAVERAERNRVGQMLADFVEANPSPEWGVYTSLDAVPEAWRKDGVLSLKRDGAPVYIGTSNEIISTAFKQMDAQKALGVLKAANAFRTLQHALIIKYNPPFALSNAFRDVGTASAKLAITHSASAAAKVVGYAPPAMFGAWRAIRNEGAGGVWGEWYREARDAGALVGWNEMGSFQDVEDAIKRSKRSAILTAIEQVNRGAELGTRIAIYRTMRESGKTQKQAALITRDGTTDFARRGNYSSQLSALYLFANANIQGTASLWRAIAANPARGSVVISALVAAGYILSMASRALGDWDDIPEYAKQRMGGVAIGDTLYGVPLPYGFDVFYYLGSRLEAAQNGRTEDSLGSDILTATLQSFSPVQGSNIVQALTPTMARPLVEISQNRDWAGIPIRPQQSPFDRTPSPRSEQTFASVDPTLKAATQGLNRLTGGDSVRPGAIDVSAEDVEHVIKFLGGGVGSNAQRVITAASHWVRGEHVRPSDIPFIRTMMTQVPESAVANLYYDNLAAIEQEGEARKKGEAIIDEKALALSGFARAVDRRVKALRKLSKENPERRTEYEATMRQAMQTLNERLAK